MSEELAMPEVEATEPLTTEAKETEAPIQDKKEGEEIKPEPTEADRVRLAMQKRIDGLTAQKRRAEARAQELEKLAQQAKPQQKQDDAPKEADYDSYEEYLVAKGRYEERKETETKAEQAKREQAEAARQADLAKKAELFKVKEAEFKQNTPDYDEAIEGLETVLSDVDKSSQGYKVFSDIMLSSENLPALSYHLGKNPELVESLKSMSLMQMARTLFVEEYKLSQQPKPKPSTKPEPPKPLGGGSKSTKSPQEMSGKEILDWLKAK